MKNQCHAPGEKLRRRLAALLAAALMFTAFAAHPGLTRRAEAAGSSSRGGEWRDIVDVIAGEGYTVALRDDGKVLYAGDNFSGAGDRIAAWDQIVRIERQGWEPYLIGYRQDGSIRLEALCDPEDYAYTTLWSERDFASWWDVEQLYLEYSLCLGLTGEGRVLALPGSVDSIELCREVSGWRDIRQLAVTGFSGVLGLKADGTVVCAAADEYGMDAKAFWESKNAPKKIRELVSGPYGVYAIDEKGTVVTGVSGAGWNNIEKLYFASDSMFGLRRDGTVAVDLSFAMGDSRLEEVARWDHIVELGFEVTGFARYVPVGLKEDGTICAVTKGYSGEPYGCWDFTGWRDVQKLFSGTDCTVGVRSDGSVLVTGGEFGTLDYQNEIARWRDIRAVYFASGEYTDHVVGLKTDGTLVAAGDNSLGQCNVNG